VDRGGPRSSRPESGQAHPEIAHLPDSDSTFVLTEDTTPIEKSLIGLDDSFQ
jgi:hypothetical protein